MRYLVALLAALVALLVGAAGASANFVYWANQGQTTIGRAKINGSGANNSFLTGITDLHGVAIDSKYVYWAQGNGATSTIGRANLDGTSPNPSFIPNSAGLNFSAASAGRSGRHAIRDLLGERRNHCRARQYRRQQPEPLAGESRGRSSSAGSRPIRASSTGWIPGSGRASAVQTRTASGPTPVSSPVSPAIVASPSTPSPSTGPHRREPLGAPRDRRGGIGRQRLHPECGPREQQRLRRRGQLAVPVLGQRRDPNEQFHRPGGADRRFAEPELHRRREQPMSDGGGALQQDHRQLDQEEEVEGHGDNQRQGPQPRPDHAQSDEHPA